MYAKPLLSLSLSLSLAALAPLGCSAAPLAHSMSASEEWTITSMSRSCAEDLSTCTWKFGIVREVLDSSSSSASDKSKSKREAEEEETPCEHVLEALGDGTPATQIRGSGPSACGAFTVTSGWSDAGGPGREFTTVSVVDYAAGLIVYPSYLDVLVAGGKVVEPDLSFPAQLIPAVPAVAV